MSLVVPPPPRVTVKYILELEFSVGMCFHVTSAMKRKGAAIRIKDLEPEGKSANLFLLRKFCHK